MSGRPELVDVLIIGSGPAGISTALHLVQADAAWAKRVVVVDKAIHPRHKLCGGGITRHGEQVLRALNLGIEVPHFPVKELRLVYRGQTYAVSDDPLFWIVRRDEFDHWLVKKAEARGIGVRQGEAVLNVEPRDTFIEVTTERGVFHAKTVVAADGSCSPIRRQLNWTDASRMSRLREVFTPESADQQPVFCEQIASFDFSRMSDGLQGYYWDFPSWMDGRAVMNRGVFDSRICAERPSVSLNDELGRALKSRGRDLSEVEPKGYPIYCFDRNGTFSRPNLILAGDAAGADPLFGEGISFALGYGEVAASAVIDAFARKDYGYADYRERILAHPLLGQLALRARLARFVYGLKSARLLSLGWRLAPLLLRVLAWRNPHYVPIRHPRLRRVK
jgi:flavin-dependent dehydrogenase